MRKLLVTVLALLLLATGVAAQDGPYEPTAESVSTHPVPDWYRDAKLGIFVHWGVYSVPAWAPPTGPLNEVLATSGWDFWFANNPYAEWYYNSLLVDGSQTQAYHAETYGADASYFDFVDDFNSAIADWDPTVWAELFAEAGAEYVVLTTKHHDGFLLWPSDTPNPMMGPDYMASRDIVGELTEAVRANDMRMGLYYSGGLDWTFNDLVITSFETLIAAIIQDPAYAEYALGHYRELIAEYNPDVLWNDLGFPAVADLNALFADYYNANPEGVVNDRFNLNPMTPLHSDFTTREYEVLEEIDPNVWESTRGLGYSFGYNQIEDVSIYLTSEELIHSLIDIVSKNGNLLINVGPMADGTIPPEQVERLQDLGAWLAVNGEAIYGTRPWVVADAVTSEGIEVRFTQKDGDLYMILLGSPTDSFTVAGLTLADGATIEILGVGPVAAENTDDGLSITLFDAQDTIAVAFRISPAPTMDEAMMTDDTAATEAMTETEAASE